MDGRTAERWQLSGERRMGHIAFDCKLPHSHRSSVAYHVDPRKVVRDEDRKERDEGYLCETDLRFLLRSGEAGITSDLHRESYLVRLSCSRIPTSAPTCPIALSAHFFPATVGKSTMLRFQFRCVGQNIIRPGWLFPASTESRHRGCRQHGMNG